MVSYSRISDSCFCSEEHIARKMGQVVAEAKAKLSKGDKKGEQHSNRFAACIVVISVLLARRKVPHFPAFVHLDTILLLNCVQHKQAHFLP